MRAVKKTRIKIIKMEVKLFNLDKKLKFLYEYTNNPIVKHLKTNVSDNKLLTLVALTYSNFHSFVHFEIFTGK